ncbi:MAG: DEAD/DEAH box helicase [Actinobacteria bacterium]|nr:DEAD/DEAH box helicase [Actinomycetota bacterium]
MASLEIVSSGREKFLADLGFPPDDFQLRAMDAIDDETSVVVAAPTGAGKTVVAEYAVAKALREGAKAFYTTPLKALSNQKYGDLVARHGSDNVGLLTGDNSINGDAPIVVMTTEVLRNMIYAVSPTLHGLRWVVLDEVHFLQDAYRGPVWEEVIIHAPRDIGLVCLSATVSNAEDLAAWVGTVRGSALAVIEEHRPVELRNLYLLGDRRSRSLHLLPTFVEGKPNPEAERFDNMAARGGGPRRRGERPPVATPRRPEVVELLSDEDMLPAIYFIFSRAACDDAVRQCVEYGIRLTNPDERKRIRAIAETKVERLSDDDLAVLDYGGWLNALESGLAAHHAGMVPPFKEAVEACFAEALVKAVFATETLALGINMPARTVVIEKLSKFTGINHQFLTPGEYTQLTGRAGRRGIDELGHAIVLWSPFVPFDQVANLASTRTYALVSAFRPTYNMATNLVRRYEPEMAHHLLNLSFAQYRSDAVVVRLEAELERLRRDAAKARDRATCDLGDVAEWRDLRADEGQRRRRKVDDNKTEVKAAFARLRPGDVVMAPGRGRVAVVASSQRRHGDVRLRALTPERRSLTLGPRDFDEPPQPVGHVDLPKPFAPRSPAFQRTVAAALGKARLKAGSETGPHSATQRGQRRRRSTADADYAVVSRASEHPVASCPDATTHLRSLSRAERLEGDARRTEQRIRSRSESLARQLDRVMRLLGAWGYVDGWSLTEAGNRLARIYHECDLLIAEAVGEGLWDGLNSAEAAALASMFTYEPRGPGPHAAARIPTAPLRHAWSRVESLGRDLRRAEEDAGLAVTRPPDPGFAEAAYEWCKGHDLAEILDGAPVGTAGDFVRNIRQLMDVVRQLAQVVEDPASSDSLRRAGDELFHGVVAASEPIGLAEGED